MKGIFRVFVAILVVCMLATTALVAYTVYLHSHVSIITYVAGEGV